MSQVSTMLGVGAVALAGDIGARELVRANIDLYRPDSDGDNFESVKIGPFYAVNTRNDGWAHNSHRGPAARWLPVAATPLGLGIAGFAAAKGGRAGAIGGGLVAAGVLGNSWEKATRGYVTDYIAAPWLPIVPNLGDVSLAVGGATAAAGLLHRYRGPMATAAKAAMRVIR